MPIPKPLLRNLKVPVIAAPMLLVSNPALVVATCRAGALASVPALNTRTTAQYEGWLQEIESQRRDSDAAYGVNLIVGAVNTRLADDLAVTIEHKVPLVITSFGLDQSVIEAVHDYGGIVFHDVASPRHVELAAKAGVDGVILLTAGAGGHTGFLNPFAFLHDARRRFDGTIILSGGLASGADIAAAVVAGADLAYMGTRFIAAAEANASPEYKAMLVAGGVADVHVTSALSGTPASFLKESLRQAGLDPDALAMRQPQIHVSPDGRELKPWKEIWSAGQGIAGIDEVLPAGELVEQLAREYHAALRRDPVGVAA
jgi:nitronate monooxygenase